jgi:hypothetical protein
MHVSVESAWPWPRRRGGGGGLEEGGWKRKKKKKQPQDGTLRVVVWACVYVCVCVYDWV